MTTLEWVLAVDVDEPRRAHGLERGRASSGGQASVDRHDRVTPIPGAAHSVDEWQAPGEVDRHEMRHASRIRTNDQRLSARGAPDSLP
jgi:hypothetical protein